MSEQPLINNKITPKREETLTLLSELYKSPHLTQRALSLRLNISLGKTNYLLHELIKEGAIKARNFSHNEGKLKKVRYILTPKGLEEKIKLTYYFLKRKETEYNLIKQEWEQLAPSLKQKENKKEAKNEQPTVFRR